jgi:hypothetical protein
MRCSNEPPIVVDAEPASGWRRRLPPVACGISPRFGSTFGGFRATHLFDPTRLFDATHRLERKHPAPRKELTHV